ncbi:MAG: tol-pal system-associated acyl-CoA thioesterase [Thiohalomonadales bacterium]
MTEFNWPIRIYYEDTDSGGVVYYANYLKFMERARTEWLRSLSIEQDELIQETGVIFAVRKVAIEYKIAARFNDLLMITTNVAKVSGASVELRQIITKDEKSIVICEATTKIVSIEAKKFKPCALPEKLKNKIFNKY